MATNLALQQESLTRATSGQSLSNYVPIIEGFSRKGIPASEIKPRENVFTYNAWKALGRQVRKGEHGVRCLTFITTTDKRGHESKRPWSTTVFHISQTDAVGTESVRLPAPPADAPRCWNQITNNEPDATPENVPYAGEEETDTAELLQHSAAVHANRPQLFSPEATVETFTSSAPEVIPAPTPKDSAYDRAMRGETVSIMDIIEEQQKQPRPAPKAFALPKRLQSAVASYQAKTVDF